MTLDISTRLIRRTVRAAKMGRARGPTNVPAWGRDSTAALLWLRAIIIEPPRRAKSLATSENSLLTEREWRKEKVCAW